MFQEDLRFVWRPAIVSGGAVEEVDGIEDGSGVYVGKEMSMENDDMNMREKIP